MLELMALSVTDFRSADSSAQEDAAAVAELLAGNGIRAEVLDDQVPGVPSGAYEVRVDPQDAEGAEALIAANPIEDEFANVDESHDLDLVTVFRSAGNSAEMEAIAVKAMLESNGMYAMVVGDSRWPNLPDEVRVPKEQATEAKRLIQAALAAGPTGAALAESETESERGKQ